MSILILFLLFFFLIGCDLGFYGTDCLEFCSLKCLTPLECNHTNGECVGKTCSVSGFKPPLCQESKLFMSDMIYGIELENTFLSL